MFKIIKTESQGSDYQGHEDGSDAPLIMNCEPERNYVRYCEVSDTRTLYTRDSSVQTDQIITVNPVEVPIEIETYGNQLIQQSSNSLGDITTQRRRQNKQLDCEERKFGCDYCEKRFKHPRAAILHMTTHNKRPRQSIETKYQCNICFKYYTQSNSLKTHMRLHTGEKPYRCEYCDKRYADQANFRKHLKIHNKGDAAGGGGRRSSQVPQRIQHTVSIIESATSRGEPSSVGAAIDVIVPSNQATESRTLYKCNLCDEKLFESELQMHIKQAHTRADSGDDEQTQ